MTDNTLKVGLLFSGGLDSAALIGHWIHHKAVIFPVYVKSGLPWEKSELSWAHRFLNATKSRGVRELRITEVLLGDAYRTNWSKTGNIPRADSDDSDVFLPARNLLLMTQACLALMSKNIDTLSIATLRGNPFADSKTSYFNLMERVLQRSFGRRIRVAAPFRNQSKVQVIQNNRTVPLHLSLSCINPQDNYHCGACNKCAERKQAFKKAGLTDKTKYLDRTNR